MSARRTYWFLEGLGRKPSDYEVASTALLYAPTARRGFEVPTPTGAFWLQHHADRALGALPWQRFADPRATTYAAYVQRQHERELFVDGLFAQLEDGARDHALNPAWRELVAGALSALRFPFHGLQMVACYLGSVAPSERVAILCAFQAADELRAVQRFAQRLGYLRRVNPALGAGGREDWEKGEAWQPLRRCVEELLVTYDFAEALVGLQQCVKPALDALALGALAAAAERAGDGVTSCALASLREDAAWHREWSAAALALASSAEPGAGVVAKAREKWLARAAEAIRPLQAVLGGSEP